MYNTKVFNTLYNLNAFLNTNHIKKDDIVNISIRENAVVLIWWKSED